MAYQTNQKALQSAPVITCILKGVNSGVHGNHPYKVLKSVSFQTRFRPRAHQVLIMAKLRISYLQCLVCHNICKEKKACIMLTAISSVIKLEYN